MPCEQGDQRIPYSVEEGRERDVGFLSREGKKREKKRKEKRKEKKRERKEKNK